MIDLINAGAHGVIVVLFLIEMRHIVMLERQVVLLERKLQKCLDDVRK